MASLHKPAAYALASLSLLLLSCAKPPVPPILGDPTPLSLPRGEATEGPRLSASADGQVVLSWMENEASGGTLRFSRLQDFRWDEPTDVVTDPDMFVNWADIPSVVPISGDTWLAHWLSKSDPATYAYDVMVSHSTDAGQSWSAPVSPHDDNTPTEHGFVSISHNGIDTQLIWLDGRNTGGGHGHDEGHGDLTMAMTLRGATVNASGEIAHDQLIDDRVCDCCRTDMAIASSGRIAVYRDRSEEEVRDIYLTRQIAGVWQPGTRLSHDDWLIEACPVNGPAVAARGDLVAVAWFTAANDQPLVRARISTDSGASFGEVILVSRQDVFGQVDIEILNDESVAVSWLEKSRRALVDQRDISVLPITVDGTIGGRTIIGRTADSRAIPQMLRHEDSLVLVWTDINDDAQTLASAKVRIKPGVATDE
jgi:hypothetical protein